jgi:hypothetical protein
MFFVMTMEVLSALIRLACEEQLLSPFPMISPLEHLSVYADDAVLFVKPLVLDLNAVKLLLQIFGNSSGLHINYNKSTATMIRGSRRAGIWSGTPCAAILYPSLSDIWACSWLSGHLQRQSGNLSWIGLWNMFLRDRGV